MEEIKMTKILAHKNPGLFRSRRVAIRRNAQGVYEAQIVRPEMDFNTLAGYRKQGPTDPQRLQLALNGEGYLFANLGVSTVLTLKYDGNTYAVAVRRDREDLGDSVAMLVSGYTDLKHLPNPQKAIFEEIAEEVLPLTSDGRVVRFATAAGQLLPEPFSDQYQNHRIKAVLTVPADYSAPGLVSPITIDGVPLAGHPKLYFQLPTDSAQLVFSYHLNFEGVDLDFKGVDLSQVSMHHSEDKFNVEEKKLEVRLHEDGLYLIRLSGGELTDDVFTMSRGQLSAVHPKLINLSEAFAPKEEGMVPRQNIPLEEYLRHIKHLKTILKFP